MFESMFKPMFPNLEPEPLAGEASYSVFQNNVIKAFVVEYPTPVYLYRPRPHVHHKEPDWLVLFDGNVELVIEAKDAQRLNSPDIDQAKNYADIFGVSAVICINFECAYSPEILAEIQSNNLGLLRYDVATNYWKWFVELEG